MPTKRTVRAQIQTVQWLCMLTKRRAQSGLCGDCGCWQNAGHSQGCAGCGEIQREGTDDDGQGCAGHGEGCAASGEIQREGTDDDGQGESDSLVPAAPVCLTRSRPSRPRANEEIKKSLPFSPRSEKKKSAIDQNNVIHFLRFVKTWRHLLGPISKPVFVNSALAARLRKRGQ